MLLSLFLICLELFLILIGAGFRTKMTVVGLILGKFLGLDMCALLNRLVHHEKGKQGVKGQRKGLHLAKLQLPCRQSRMHLKELFLPRVVFDLPLARHATTGIVAMVAHIVFLIFTTAEEEKFEAFCYLVTDHTDAILNELVLLCILNHVAEVFSSFILHQLGIILFPYLH